MQPDDSSDLVVEFRTSAGAGAVRAVVRDFDSGLDVRRLVPLDDHARPGRFSARRGWWWSSTTGAHVRYVGNAESEGLLQLDADPAVEWIVHQPLRVHCGETSCEVPFVVELGGMISTVLPEDADGAALVGKFAAAVGWVAHCVEPLSPARRNNLKWLAGFRHPRYDDGEVAETAQSKLLAPMALAEASALFGLPSPRVLPVLYHLVWNGSLHVDLDSLLDSDSLIWSRPL